MKLKAIITQSSVVTFALSTCQSNNIVAILPKVLPIGFLWSSSSLYSEESQDQQLRDIFLSSQSPKQLITIKLMLPRRYMEVPFKSGATSIAFFWIETEELNEDFQPKNSP